MNYHFQKFESFFKASYLPVLTVVLLLFLVNESIYAQPGGGTTTYTWTGNNSTNWSTGQNWNTSGGGPGQGGGNNTPGENDDVVIEALNGFNPNYPDYSTGETEISNLTIESETWGGNTNNAELSVSGGTLTVSNTLTVDGILYLEGGTLSTNDLDGDGTIYLNGGTLEINGNNNFNGEFVVTECGSNIDMSTGTFTLGDDSDYLPEGTYNNLETNSNVTLCGDVTVSGTLTLGGTITLGEYNLTSEDDIEDGSNNYFASNYIITDGEGFFIKSVWNINDLITTYPVGSGGYYTPMVVTAVTGSGTNSISVRAVSTDMGDEYIDKYWDVETEITDYTVTAYFIYDDAEINGTEDDYLAWYRSASETWTNPSGGYVDAAENILYTPTLTNAIEGYWTAGETGTPPLIWYSYQNGDWDTWETWTLDPSGTLRSNDEEAVPGSSDQVVILNGDVVTISDDNKTISYLTIEEGGTLDIGETSGHSFSTIDGAGLFQLSTDDLDIPATSGTFFEAGGGTVEYYASGTTTSVFSDFTFNNLIINMGITTDRVTCVGDLTVHGDLTVTSGIFRINNNSTTSLDLVFEGDITVESDGQIITGTGNVIHTMSVSGDFTNDGNVRFTNRNAPVIFDYLDTDPDNGGVTVSFTGLADNTLTCNNITDFHRLIVDKGDDQTYILTVTSADETYFRLFGRNDQEATDYDANTTNLEGVLKNLWIKNGTLKLEGTMHIPSLTEGGGDNYHIPLNGCLWLNGDDVIVDATWEGSGSSSGNQAIVPFGKLRVDAGTLDCKENGGLIYRGTAEFEFNGGTILATQFRPSSYSDDALTSFTMTGGEMTLYGKDYGNDYEVNAAKAIFCLPFSTNTFVMSGGTISVTNTNSVGALVIAADNVDVTGGEVNISVGNNYFYNGEYTDAYYYINSTAPFYDLNILQTDATKEVIVNDITTAGLSGDVSSLTLEAQPLYVLNDLTIDGASSAVLNLNSNDLYVGGDFTIESGGTYTPGENTTYFNGGGSQTLANSGTVTDGMENVTLTENGTDLTIDGDNTTLTINNQLTIEDGTIIRDNGNIVYVYGDIENSGTQYHATSGAGSIQLTGTADQEITGDGSGSFNNLSLNKTGGSVTLSANATFTGNLRLAGAASAIVPTRFDIGSYNILIDSTANIYTGLTGTSTSFSRYCMIVTNGLASDEGISRKYNSDDAFTFPFGFYSNSTYYYMPGKIGFSDSPTTYGTITSCPVAERHPLAITNNALSCYWVTESTGFEGISTSAVEHKYYHDADILSDDFITGTESNYVPAVYCDGDSWSYHDAIDVNEGTNEVLYNETDTLTGEFTAGEEDAFDGTIDVLYSVADGNWTDASTWSTVRGDATTGNTEIPTSSTIVYVCDTHTVSTVANGAEAAKVIIEKESTLDLSTYTGHDLTIGTGHGTLSIASSEYFPSGDWGDLLQLGGGTVEYYNNGSAIAIPLTSDETGYTLNHYNNLVLTLAGDYDINFPDTDLEIFSNITIDGTGSGQSLTNNSAEHTIIIDSAFIQNGGTFTIQNTYAQTIQVNGDMNIYDGTYMVNDGDGVVVDHTLYLYGNLYNDGTIQLTQDIVGSTGHVDVIFKDSENTTISGSGTNALYSLEVDKGSDITSILTVQSPLTTVFDPALTITNGTFRWDNTGSFDASVDAAFPIPATGCLSVNQGTLNVVNYSTETSNGVTLSGTLEVLGGTMNIGKTATNTYHNDIEYASSGTPAITIEDGTLNVYGQIRRSTSNTQGALNYEQSGGTVNVYGQNADATQLTRAKLEICNSNSSFTMSGGTINILTGDGTTYGDLYIRPEAYDVKGGTIVMGSETDLTSAQNYILDASCNLYNLEIAGTSTTYSSDAVLSVNDLILSGDLTINEYATLTTGTQSVDVTIAGDFTNDGTYTPNTNTTTFDGAKEQTATFDSTTDFYNLSIDKSSGTITLAGTAQPSVTNDMSITSGTIDDGDRTLTVYGDITNEAVHTSTSGNITLAGSSTQIISGDDNGQFGNLVINNSAGIVQMEANTTINGELIFTTGYLYIKDYLLTLGEDASIGGTVEANQCIVTNGVLSDAGVKKIFSSSSTSGSFLYPVGIVDKYTPAEISLDYSGEGSITVKPVNSVIPSVTNTDIDELQYYWDVASSGFTSYSNVDHSYNYLQTDLSGITEDDADYIAARYYNYVWYTAADGTPISIDTVANTIDVTAANFIDGDYTCGHTDNFGDKLLYYSRNGATDIEGDGASWTNPNTWAIGSHDGVVAVDAPDGNPMFIAEDHVILIDADNQSAYSVCDSGILNIQTYTGHNLGVVSGNGRIIIQNSTAGQFVFPGGVYTSFMNTEGSTIEYNGITESSGADISPTIKTYQNLEFTGSEVKYLSNVNIKVQGNLLITGSEVDNSTYDKNITVWGNWTDEYENGYIAGNGTVTFADTLASVITTTDSEEFYNLAIDKTSDEEVTLQGPVTVSNNLELTRGIVNTDETNILTLSSTSTSVVTGGSDSSYVDGPLAKNITSGSSFSFPIGDEDRFGQIELPSVTSETTPDYWTAEYFNADPNEINSDDSLMSPITSISDNEYWTVTRPESGTNTANITLRWDDDSYPGITSDATARDYLRVVEYDGSLEWNVRGDDMDETEQTVSTTEEVEEDNYIFTLGLAGITATLTKTSVDDICNNGTTASIPVTLTGTANWTLSYRVTNTSTNKYLDFTITGISTESYSISLTGEDLSSLLDTNATTNFTTTLLSVSDNSGSTGICTGTTTFSVLRTNIPDISGTFTVGVEELRTFSTKEYSSDTYAWSWSGTSGGTIPTGSSYTKNITMSATAGTYILVVSETTASTSCVATDQQTIIVSETPSPEITPTTANVCQGDIISYSTPSVEDHKYEWVVKGGTYYADPTTDSSSITVTWKTAGSGYIKVTETNENNFSDTAHVNYYVNDSIKTTYTLSAEDTTVCTGGYTTLNLSGSQTGITYELRLASNDSTIQSKTGTGSALSFTTDSLKVTKDSTVTYYIYAYNSGCYEILSGIAITFTPGMTISASASNDTICFGATVELSTANVSTYSYLWTTSITGTQKELSDSTAATTIYTPATNPTNPYVVTTTFTVTATDENNCIGTDSIDITLFRRPESRSAYHIKNAWGK